MLEVFKNVFTPSNVEFLAKGMALTLLLSISVVLISILFGTILALLRTYEKRVMGKLAGFYIEMFRNTPPIAVDSGLLFYDSLRHHCLSGRFGFDLIYFSGYCRNRSWWFKFCC